MLYCGGNETTTSPSEEPDSRYGSSQSKNKEMVFGWYPTKGTYDAGHFARTWAQLQHLWSLLIDR